MSKLITASVLPLLATSAAVAQIAVPAGPLGGPTVGPRDPCSISEEQFRGDEHTYKATYYAYKDREVPVVQPRKFTDVLFVDVPRTRNYLVFGKTEVQNNGQSSQFTCEMAAYDLTSGRIAASDAVSVFVPQGQFTGFAFTFVAPGDFSLVRVPGRGVNPTTAAA